MSILQVLQVCISFMRTSLSWGGVMMTSVVLPSTIYTWFYLGYYYRTSYDLQGLASSTVLHSMDRSALPGLRLCVSVVDG